MLMNTNKIKALPSCAVPYRRMHVTWMAHPGGGCSPSVPRSCEQPLGDLVHRLLWPRTTRPASSRRSRCPFPRAARQRCLAHRMRNSAADGTGIRLTPSSLRELLARSAGCRVSGDQPPVALTAQRRVDQSFNRPPGVASPWLVLRKYPSVVRGSAARPAVAREHTQLHADPRGRELLNLARRATCNQSQEIGEGPCPYVAFPMRTSTTT
jgi:hypothetical protein